MARKMHQTTVRFGADLWEELEREAARTGVSVAQYVREAALARLVHSASLRGEAMFGSATPDSSGAPTQGAIHAFVQAEDESASADALWAQGRQARERARTLREASVERRGAGRT